MGFNQEKVNMHTCASFLKDAKMHWHWQIKNEANCQQEIQKTLKGTTIREGISSIKAHNYLVII